MASETKGTTGTGPEKGNGYMGNGMLAKCKRKFYLLKPGRQIQTNDKQETVKPEQGPANPTQLKHMEHSRVSRPSLVRLY
ncbi:unnamed protein product [Arctogadus glacialis]